MVPCAPSNSTRRPAAIASARNAPVSHRYGTIRARTRPNCSEVSRALSGLALSTAVRYLFFSAILRASFSPKRRGFFSSSKRIPTRAILSSYAGPMPKPVVPIARRPARASRARSIARWYGSTICASQLSLSRLSSRNRPRERSVAISSANAIGSTTVPLPITQTLPGCSAPAGISRRMNFSPSTTSVCAALLPPWKRTTTSASAASRSTILPLPSSPH